MIRRIQLVGLSLTLLGALLLMGAKPAEAQSTDSARFTTPSGNINCAVYEDPEGDYGNCLVKSNTWKNKKKKPADCDLDWEPAEISVISQPSGSTFRNATFVGSCRGDIGPLCAPDACSTLDYGETVKVGRISCTSQKAGITCVTTKGKKRGFTIARAGYTLIK
jgi:hypothetical protein